METAVAWLRKEYERRENKNPRYSLRAFAKFLGFAPGALSEILAHKRELSWDLAIRCSDRLKLSPSEQKKFLTLAKNQQEMKKQIRRVRQMDDDGFNFKSLDEDIFHFISDWPHFAILSLSHVQDFNPEPTWIAGRLGLKISEVVGAVDRLRRLGLIRSAPGKSGWEATEARLTTGKDIPSDAVRRYHYQCLSRAQIALDEVEVSARDVTSITMAIDPQRLPLAKEMIRRFRRQVAEILEDEGGNRTAVYQLNVQLLPMTKISTGGEIT
jgi:uncharacterized protein (TIGR02147 family)